MVYASSSFNKRESDRVLKSQNLTETLQLPMQITSNRCRSKPITMNLEEEFKLICFPESLESSLILLSPSFSMSSQSRNTHTFTSYILIEPGAPAPPNYTFSYQALISLLNCYESLLPHHTGALASSPGPSNYTSTELPV